MKEYSSGTVYLGLFMFVFFAFPSVFGEEFIDAVILIDKTGQGDDMIISNFDPSTGTEKRIQYYNDALDKAKPTDILVALPVKNIELQRHNMELSYNLLSNVETVGLVEDVLNFFHNKKQYHYQNDKLTSSSWKNYWSTNYSFTPAGNNYLMQMESLVDKFLYSEIDFCPIRDHTCVIKKLDTTTVINMKNTDMDYAEEYQYREPSKTVVTNQQNTDPPSLKSADPPSLKSADPPSLKSADPPSLKSADPPSSEIMFESQNPFTETYSSTEYASDLNFNGSLVMVVAGGITSGVVSAAAGFYLTKHGIHPSPIKSQTTPISPASIEPDITVRIGDKVIKIYHAGNDGGVVY